MHARLRRHEDDPGSGVYPHQEEPNVTLVVSPSRVGWFLSLVAVALTVVSLIAQFSYIFLGPGEFTRLLPMLFVGKDDSLPGWYSSVILLSCSVLLAAIARVVSRSGERYAFHWAVLAAVFLYLAVDEGVAIHEKLSPLGRAMLRAFGVESGLISRAWVVPAIIVVIVVALAYLRFLLRLPRRTKRLFVVAGILFVGAAIGMEVATDLYVYVRGGLPNLTIFDNVLRTVILPHLEELLEMLSIVVFVYALLAYAGTLLEKYEFVFGD